MGGGGGVELKKIVIVKPIPFWDSETLNLNRILERNLEKRIIK